MNMIIKKQMPIKKNPDMTIAVTSNKTTSITTNVIEKVVKPTNEKIMSFVGTDNSFSDMSKVRANMLKMGDSNQIECVSFYIDSNGDLIKNGICEGTVITEFEYSKENFNFICLSNNADSETEYYTENTNTITRAPRQKTSDSDIEICEIKLGYWRKLFKDNTNNLIIGTRTYYDKNNGAKKDTDKDGNIDYRTIISCKPENQLLAIEHIKNIAKADKAIYIDWFI